MLAPGQAPPRVTSLPDVGDWSAPAPALALSQPRPATAVPVTTVSLPAPSLTPHFGSTPPAAPAAPVTPLAPAPALESLSLAERIRDLTGS